MKKALLNLLYSAFFQCGGNLKYGSMKRRAKYPKQPEKTLHTFKNVRNKYRIIKVYSNLLFILPCRIMKNMKILINRTD